MGKKVHGEGSVFQRKDGRWQGDFSVEGKRYTVYGKTEKECRAALRVKRADIERGLQAATTWTFKRYVEYWIEAKEHKYRANTFYRVRHFMDAYAIPEWGSLKLAKLTQAHFQTWVNGLVKEGELKASTIRQYFAYVHTALEYAVRTRMLPFNPCQYVELPSLDEKEEPAIFTVSQAAELIELSQEPWASLFCFIIGTGARRNEALACRWADLDLEMGRWKVTHNFAVLPGGIVEGKPKTRSSIRTIILPKFVHSMLIDLQHEQKKLKLKVGADWENKDLVFCTETGGILPDYRLYWAFNATLSKMGLSEEEISRLHPHSLRHSMATWLYDDGVLPQEIQALLGHSTLAMTTDVYGGRMPGRAEQTMERLNEIVEGEQQDKRDKSG